MTLWITAIDRFYGLANIRLAGLAYYRRADENPCQYKVLR
jgi:hypothetical protein